MGQLLRRQLRKRVRLIFRRLACEQMRTVVAVREARVVTGRHIVRADAIGETLQGPQLHEVIAGYTWIRRAPAPVRIDEAIDDVALERLLEVEDVMRNAEGGGAASRVIEIVRSAARLRVRGSRRDVHFHGHADHIAAALGEEAGGDRRIDAGAHRGDYAGFRHTATRITEEPR